jgi:hypothetical protein
VPGHVNSVVGADERCAAVDEQMPCPRKPMHAAYRSNTLARHCMAALVCPPLASKLTAGRRREIVRGGKRHPFTRAHFKDVVLNKRLCSRSIPRSSV